MTDNIDYSNRALLDNYIEKISAVQNSIQELQVEIGQLRRDARIDGFNMEAVHTLAQIISKSSHDGGLGLLRDILTYAQRTGIELETVNVQADPEAKEDSVNPKYEDASPSVYRTIHTLVDRRLVTLFQFGLGLGVAWMFISLLQ